MTDKLSDSEFSKLTSSCVSVTKYSLPIIGVIGPQRRCVVCENKYYGVQLKYLTSDFNNEI